MRELKFRMFFNMFNKMTYDDWEYTCLLLQLDALHDREPDPEEKIIGFSRYHEQKYAHVMQYTGLKDRYGVEIWEDDIVSIPNLGNTRVKYESGKFNIVDMSYNECTVMGNVYENLNLNYSE